MISGDALARTPLGSRLVFLFSAATYCLFIFDHHDFISLDLVCRPGDVVYGLQLQRLFLASFAHTSLPSLCLAIGLCWRRFAWLEHERGTLGFLAWFAWASLLLHGTFCLVAVCFSAFLGSPSLLGAEVHGLFPLLVASLVASQRDSDSTEVWLWPLPFHVNVRWFPFVVIGLCWLFHMSAHFDVVVSYFVASSAPDFVEPGSMDVWLLHQFETTPFGRWLGSLLEGSDAFVCRPPTAVTGGLDKPTLAAPAFRQDVYSEPVAAIRHDVYSEPAAAILESGLGQSPNFAPAPPSSHISPQAKERGPPEPPRVLSLASPMAAPGDPPRAEEEPPPAAVAGGLGNISAEDLANL